MSLTSFIIRVFSLFLICLLITSCKKDNCSEVEWEGTYSGTKSENGVVIDNYIFSVSMDTSLPIDSLPETGTMIQRYLIDGIIFLTEDCTITGGPVTNIGLTSYEGSLDGEVLSITRREGNNTTIWSAIKR